MRVYFVLMTVSRWRCEKEKSDFAFAYIESTWFQCNPYCLVQLIRWQIEFRWQFPMRTYLYRKCSMHHISFYSLSYMMWTRLRSNHWKMMSKTKDIEMQIMLIMITFHFDLLVCLISPIHLSVLLICWLFFRSRSSYSHVFNPLTWYFEKQFVVV